MKKLFNFIKRFWIVPMPNGGFRFQLNIPIGKKKK